MIKVGVAGVGHLGQHHARIFSNLDNCEFVGIYDIDKKRMREISGKLHTDYFDDYELLLEKCDAIDIAVTTISHYELAFKALSMGKHVFIEKPITSRLDEADNLINLAKKNNLKLQVGHIERFNPVVLLAAGDITDPMFIESHRLAPFNPRGIDVPVVLDLMIHDIDLILSFIKSKLVDIRASGVKILTKNIDIANARLEFENGAIANVTSSRVSMKRERKLRFFQKDSYISMDFQEKIVKVLKKSKNLKSLLPEILLGKTTFNPEELVDVKTLQPESDHKDALTLELESFLHSIISNSKPEVDGEDGRRALKVAIEILEKMNT